MIATPGADVPFAALFGLSLVLPRRVQIIPRARVVASAANDTLTVGDALAGSLRRNIADLPEHEHLARAERTLDAMLVSGSAELDALQREFDRDLAQTSDSLDQVLTSGLQRVAATYNETFDYAAAELDTVFASTRDGVSSYRFHSQHAATAAATRLASVRLAQHLRLTTQLSL